MSKLLTLGLAAALSITSAGTIAADDAEIAKGKRQFNKCRACHTLTDNGKKRQGPHLASLLGRASASIDGFKYSDALKNANLTWDEATLDAWLQSPRKYLPGNRMVFVGLRKPADRAALIAYLKEATAE